MAWSNIPRTNGLEFRANLNAAIEALYDQLSTSPNANTAALRDGNGDLSAAHFNGGGSGLTGVAANLTAGAVNLAADGANYNRLIPFAAGVGAQALGVSSVFTYNPANGRLYAPYFVANFGTTPYFNAIDSGGRFINVGVDSTDTTYPGFFVSIAGIKFQTNSGGLTPLKLTGNLATFGGPVRGGWGSDTSLIAQAWCFSTGFPSSPYVVAGSNISSISIVNSGKYTFNFATAMVDANYAAFAEDYAAGSDGVWVFVELFSKTASGVTFAWHGSGGGGVVPAGASILVFR